LVSKKNKSIHLENFLEFPKKFDNIELNNKWNQLIKIRDICNLSIEEKRSSKEIGSSLEAALTVKLDEQSLKLIKDIDLSELCITSSVNIKKETFDEISVDTKKAEGNKCPVCWKISKSPCSRHKS
jgi:isoleucyl-tRNA synthetase